MQSYQVGPFKDAESFAENFIKMLAFNSVIVELMDWMKDVELGLNDPNLPAEVKAQAAIDYNEIQKRFNEFSGSIPSA